MHRRRACSATLAVGFVLSAAVAPGAEPQLGDDLLVVDCLLPGQIRRLGQRTTYVSPRRPLKTTARDCQIRGGEYAAYDRADLATSLAVWLPAAEKGDAEAGTIVGEILERGLGTAPDYPAAAEWYRRASTQGSVRAQINLGHLYEKGLGVARDPREALQWYRRAAGLESGIDLDSGSRPIAVESEELRGEVNRLRSESQSLRTELERVRRQLEEAQSIPAPPPAQPEAALTSPPARIEQEVDSLRQQLAAGMEETERLDRLVVESRRELARSREELERARQDHATRLRELERSNAALDEQRRAADEGTARIRSLETALTGRESRIEHQHAETERLRGELARLQAQLESQSTRLSQYEQTAQRAAQALMAGPEISLIEPQLLGTRDIVLAAASLGAAAGRDIIGRVAAPAGLLTLQVNEQRVAPNEHGVFTARVPVDSTGTAVKVVAVDRQGKQAVVEFAFRMRAQSAAPAAAAVAPASTPAGVDFGNFHALVIGNDEYVHLRDLRTAVVDAKSVAALLEQRYGFRTQLLTNANRYAILSALNSLRESLTSDDNLVIYYAGHGVLDDVNNRGHWLPVDAEAGSSANWIPTTAVTDILNIMKARQVLVVVDSCYAGALTRSSMARLSTATTPDERLHWLRAVMRKRARVVLTSGGIAPVLDSGGGAHSVFAKALLDVLASNVELLDGQRLFREVAARVSYAAGNVGFDQVPEYAPIRYAGHEAGEFFFVPRS